VTFIVCRLHSKEECEDRGGARRRKVGNGEGFFAACGKFGGNRKTGLEGLSQGDAFCKSFVNSETFSMGDLEWVMS
jgi:hypothetical protein